MGRAAVAKTYNTKAVFPGRWSWRTRARAVPCRPVPGPIFEAWNPPEFGTMRDPTSPTACSRIHGGAAVLRANRGCHPGRRWNIGAARIRACLRETVPVPAMDAKKADVFTPLHRPLSFRSRTGGPRPRVATLAFEETMLRMSQPARALLFASAPTLAGPGPPLRDV